MSFLNINLELGFDIIYRQKIVGDIVAKWITCGTLNKHIVGLSLSAASWLTM